MPRQGSPDERRQALPARGTYVHMHKHSKKQFSVGGNRLGERVRESMNEINRRELN